MTGFVGWSYLSGGGAFDEGTVCFMNDIERQFDCIEFNRTAALRIHAETARLTTAQKLEYWRKYYDATRAQKAAIEQLVDSSPPS